MGNRKRIVAGITGAAALIVAPFIHNAFSAAAANGASNDTPASTASASTSDSTTVPTNSASTTPPSASTDNADKDKGKMPVSVHTEITNGQTSVTVNGEHVDVPDNGSIQKTVSDNNSTTNINIQMDGTNGSANTTTRTTGGTTRVSSRTSSSVNVSTHTRSTE